MRYSLIIKDKTGVEIYQEAIKRGLTMGRYLNDIIETRNKGPIPDKKITCVICGRKPTAYGIAFDTSKVYFCMIHSRYTKFFSAYGQIDLEKAVKIAESPGANDAKANV